eukprot:Skav227142  [mRNA]  locus=scaffold133:542673:542870:+ [translate_table: standard]
MDEVNDVQGMNPQIKKLKIGSTTNCPCPAEKCTVHVAITTGIAEGKTCQELQQGQGLLPLPCPLI